MRLLLVDDDPAVLAGLRRALWPMRGQWEIHTAGGVFDALAKFDEQPFDVVLSDMRMPDADGAMLLQAVAERWPATVRIALSGDCDHNTAVHAAAVCHQFLSKPCDVQQLRDVVARADALGGLLKDPGLRGLVGAIGELPTMPSIYDELCVLLADPDAPLSGVAKLVQRDPALTTKLLQLVNSAFFGRGSAIVRVDQAVQLLGLTVVRSVLLTHAVYSEWAPGALADIAREQAHSLRVALAARQLVAPVDADAAFMAGLLHDIGKLLLVSQSPLLYADAAREAAQRHLPLHHVERERRGATHAEIGGYLLGLWNLPPAVVTAVAFHHAPTQAPTSGGTLPVLAAVHVANILDHMGQGDEAAGDDLDVAYLSSQGMPPAIDLWRDLLQQAAAVTG